MKLGIWSTLSFLTGTISTQSTFLDQDKPLHIGVSIGLASRSHIKYLLEILEQVSKKGHRITFLSANEFKRFSEGYDVTHYSLGNLALNMETNGDTLPFTSNDSVRKGFDLMMPTVVEFYRTSFPFYQTFYREEKPDLMICDYFSNSCIESAAKNTIPMMMGYQSIIGSIPSPYLTIKGVFEPTSIASYTFLERFKHGIIDPLNLIIDSMYWEKGLAPLRNHYNIPMGFGSPKFGHLGLGLANSFIGFENPRKIPSHMNVIGPILSESLPILPENLELFLNQHSKVLYIAFGSLIQIRPDLAQDLLQYFQRALNDGILDGIVWGGLGNTNFDRFPKSFKVDDHEYSTQSMLENTHDKIKLLKWAPQEAILNHPNTKLFLSHGGLESIYESLASATPLLILPFLADQPRNGILVSEIGVGDYIEYPKMSDEVIYQKFIKLLDHSNLELQSKLQHMQLITKLSSKRKAIAADLIETYAYSAKSCRMFSTPKPFEVPCEMKPFLPLDYTMSSIKANLIDVYISAIILISTISFVLIYFITKIMLNLFKSLTKQKIE